MANALIMSFQMQFVIMLKLCSIIYGINTFTYRLLPNYT